jgi:hypothetical protein
MNREEAIAWEEECLAAVREFLELSRDFDDGEKGARFIEARLEGEPGQREIVVILEHVPTGRRSRVEWGSLWSTEVHLGGPEQPTRIAAWSIPTSWSTSLHACGHRPSDPWTRGRHTSGVIGRGDRVGVAPEASV